MNVCFRLPSEDLEAQFLAEAAEQDLVALKGHRSFGGLRISIYNAVAEASVDALVSLVKDFEKANGEAHPTGAGPPYRVSPRYWRRSDTVPSMPRALSHVPERASPLPSTVWK